MSIMPEIEFKELLGENNFSLPRRFVLQTPKDYLGTFPAVLKISSEEIAHKTEAGAVITGLKDKSELVNSFSLLRKKFPGESIYAEEMATKGVEVIIGMIKNRDFGKLIMLGIGGFYSELIGDVSFKKIPINEFDAEDMMNELRFKRILDGYRGLKASRKILNSLLLKVSRFGEGIDFIQMDFNPVFLYEDSYLVVDAKLMV